MTGLDKIIRQIQLDADSTCETVLSKNLAECSAITEKANAEAELIRKNGEDKALKNYDNIIKRAYSTAQIEERKILLSAKQRVVSDMVAAALDYFRNLDENSYFDLLYKLIYQYSLNSEGIILISSKDKSRLPADFVERANAVSKGKLTLGNESINIDGGFVLVYGGIDVNCSFSSLFADNSDIISDKVAELLFAEV